MTKDKLYGSRDSDHAIVHSGLNVSSSAHNYGCVVDGGNANGSDLSIIIIIINNKNTTNNKNNINTQTKKCVDKKRADEKRVDEKRADEMRADMALCVTTWPPMACLIRKPLLQPVK